MPRTAQVDPIKKQYRYRQIDPDDARFNNESRRWKPMDWQLRLVERLAGYSLPIHQIAKLLNVSPEMLHRECQNELELGIAEANAIILAKAFLMMREGDGQMIRFYLARRLGWVEPKVNEAAIIEDLGELTDEEIRAELGALASRARTATSQRGLAPPV